MAWCSIFPGLRRSRRGLGVVLAYALLLNALIAAVFNVQAIAAAIDPLAAAAICDRTGRDPVSHSNQHQPDCTLCGPACPMGGGLAQGLEAATALVAPVPAFFALDARAPRQAGVHPRSIYRSDRLAQAPPAIA